MHSAVMRFFSVCLVASSLVSADPQGSLSGILQRYETLHRKDLLHQRVKRDTDNKDVKELNFHTLGRDFKIHLKKNLGVLAAGFQVFAIDKNSNARRVDVDVSNIYHGYVDGEADSSVQAYFEEGGEDGEDLNAKIQTKDDVYVIEPSWRHLPKSNNHSMIAYRGSDLNIENDFGAKYCGHVRPDGSDEAAYDSVDHNVEDLILDGHSESEGESERYRRQIKYAGSYTPDKDTCSMLLVADYKFFEEMGQKSLSRTTSYLISLIDRVNHIYRNTRWANGFFGVGIGIKEILIHEEPTKTRPGEIHYNSDVQWDTKDLLEYFSRQSRYKDFCLAHLFTHQAFEGGVLGLAYIAAPRTHSVGGICSQDYYKNNAQLYLNTGWSSSLNSYSRRLLTQEADLVTTHEIGHNWGSEHDPSTDECAPSSFDGGKYIMYTYSVSGYNPNNKIFSDCSKRSIGAVLDIKSSKCFSQPIKAYCGNMQVEEGEECDPGALGDGKEDPCCDKEKCTLKPNAVCSDSNDLCCRGCRYAPPSVACHVAQEGSCEATANCTGYQKTCPHPPYKNNGSECIGRGKCEGGICVPFCETRGKMSCACDETLNVDDSCKWCCRDNSTSKCLPYDDGTGVKNLPKGMPCLKGYCTEDGICDEKVEDLVQRIWDIIEQLAPNKIVAFMRANIVGTVIILSLFIWIPASCVVCHIDRKHKQNDLDEIDWLRSDNTKLVAPTDMGKIRTVPGMKPRPRRPEGNILHDYYKPQSQL